MDRDEAGSAMMGRVMREAQDLARDVDRHLQQFPPLENDMPAPHWGWGEIERQLESLASYAPYREVVAPTVAAIRKTSALKPPGLVLRELLCAASGLLEEPSEHPDWMFSREGEEDMP